MVSVLILNDKVACLGSSRFTADDIVVSDNASGVPVQLIRLLSRQRLMFSTDNPAAVIAQYLTDWL
jgi:hypothetical protein